jgi:hypothetical protein
MMFEVEEVAPWMSKADADAMIDHIMRMPVPERGRLTTAEAIGKRVNLRYEEREAFGLWRIAPVDISPTMQADRRKAKKRARSMKARREAGAVPRQEYLATSLSRSQPWKALGISRRTWERRQVKEAAASPRQISLIKADTDLRHMPCAAPLARSARELVTGPVEPNQSQPVSCGHGLASPSYGHGPVSPSGGYVLVPGKPAYCRTTITEVALPDTPSEPEWRRKECQTKSK